MDEQELMKMIQQIMASRGQSGQQRRPASGGGFGSAPIQSGAYIGRPEDANPAQMENLRGQYQRWANQGYGQVSLGNLGMGPIPSSLQGIMQAHPRDLSLQAAGGITPGFAQAMNDTLYKGMNFRTGEQSMGQILGKPAEAGLPHNTNFSRPVYDALMQIQNDPRVDRETKKRLMDQYLSEGGTLL